MVTVLRYENSCHSVSVGCGSSYTPVVCLLPTLHNSTIKGNNEIQLGIVKIKLNSLKKEVSTLEL